MIDHFPIQTERFFVFFDAGETTALRPVLEKLQSTNQDFQVLVMGTAATLIKKSDFPGKVLELCDFGIGEKFDQTTPRETKLPKDARMKIAERIQPKILVVGAVSKAQQQMLRTFNHVSGLTFIDNFFFDPKNQSFATVNKVQQAASTVLCPSFQTLVQLQSLTDLPNARPKRKYQVVGKPTVDVWAKRIAQVDQTEVLKKLGFHQEAGPIAVFIGGYGEGYDLINPFFEECAARLRREGYQVIMQPHPKIAKAKVETIEALAVADYVVGYNSSVLFDSLLIGKKAIYVAPLGLSYDHFAIKQGYAPQVENEEQLVSEMQKGTSSSLDIKEKLMIPEDSVKAILEAMKENLPTKADNKISWLQTVVGTVFRRSLCC